MVYVYRVKIEEKIHFPKCCGCSDELKEDAMIIERDDKEKFEIYCIECYVDLVIEEDLCDYLENFYEEKKEITNDNNKKDKCN